MAYIGCEVIHKCSNGYEYYYHEEELIRLVQDRIYVDENIIRESIDYLSKMTIISTECDKNGDTVYDDGDIDQMVDHIEYIKENIL